jgi:hypothetical protein
MLEGYCLMKTKNEAVWSGAYLASLRRNMPHLPSWYISGYSTLKVKAADKFISEYTVKSPRMQQAYLETSLCREPQI